MLIIRPADDGDLDSILAIYNDAVVNTTAVYDYEPRDAEAQERWFAAKREQGLPVIVAEIGGAVAGFASFGPFRPWPAYLHTVENSVYIAPDRRGQGVGSALIPPLLDLARTKGLHTMVAGIDATNEASLRLHRKFGFEPVGLFKEVGWKFGRWLDLVFLQLPLTGSGAGAGVP